MVLLKRLSHFRKQLGIGGDIFAQKLQFIFCCCQFLLNRTKKVMYNFSSAKSYMFTSIQMFFFSIKMFTDQVATLQLLLYLLCTCCISTSYRYVIFIVYTVYLLYIQVGSVYLLYIFCIPPLYLLNIYCISELDGVGPIDNRPFTD